MAYKFVYDWFSPNIPVFRRILEPYSGKPCKVLEIGTHEGRSTTWLLENILTHHDSRILCIDILKEEMLEHNLGETGAPWKVELKIGPSRDILTVVPASEYDFAYVDGSHHACDVLEDAVLTFRKVKVGGIIGFDDYLWDDPNFNQHGTPKPAIDAFLACYAHKVEVIENGYQVWIRKLAD
jgi:predicted O-methyltransferase YrrM